MHDHVEKLARGSVIDGIGCHIGLVIQACADFVIATLVAPLGLGDCSNIPNRLPLIVLEGVFKVE